MKLKATLLLSLFTLSAIAADAPAPLATPYLQANPYLQNTPYQYGYGAPAPIKPWTMSPSKTKEEKTRMMRMMMPWMAQGMHMNIRDVMNYMTTKYKAKPGLSFDDVVESMKLKANELNFKLVGHSPMWKDIQAVLGDTTTPRMEVFNFCDIATGREVMKMAPESIAFLPCRIAVMEDADKNIWVLTLDWDIAWLDSVNGSMGVSPDLAKMAIDIRDRMDQIMQAAANGDL
ncbi:MAG TPA: DUF302 domain-containing protein [Thiobacillaceae bacterium]|nr:DUF302 domain-containing protein [Thiobacillaceae bacterium]